MSGARIVVGCAVVASGFFAFANVACSTKDCSLVGCSSGVDVTVHLDTAVENLNGATLAMCLNDSCWSAVATFPDAGPIYSEELVFPLAGGPVEDEVKLSSAEQGSYAQFEHNVFGDEVAEDDGAVIHLPLNDGDRYEIKITLANGDQLVDQVATTSYPTILQPNGSECAPTCKRDTIVMWQ